MDVNGWLEFSQQRGVFAAGGQFRSGGAFSQPISQLRNDTRVPRGGFAAVKIFAEDDYGAAKSFRSEGPFSQPSLDFATGFLGLRNHFAANGHFRRGLFWVAKFRRP